MPGECVGALEGWNGVGFEVAVVGGSGAARVGVPSSPGSVVAERL
jgi:hypothetical protein